MMGKVPANRVAAALDIRRFFMFLSFLEQVRNFKAPTHVESERSFSSLGLLVTKRRLCMTWENVNKQLFLKDKLKKQI